MKKLSFKYFKWTIIFLLLSHLYGVVERGFEYPFDDMYDFFKKLFITLGFAIPFYLVLSIIVGFLIGWISWEIKTRKEKKNGSQA